MSPNSLVTPRLRFVPVTIELLAVDRTPSEALARQLGATIPESWPPELYDDDARNWLVAKLKSDPGVSTWLAWYMVLKGEDGSPDIVVGTVGFKGPPDPDGVVELGYGVLEPFRRRGLASEAVRGMIEYAFDDPNVKAVAAETYPELVNSIGVMEKNRMTFVGPSVEPRVIRYAVTRDRWFASG